MRLTFGNWDADLVKDVRQASEPVLLTLTERKIRYELMKISNYHAQTCLKAVDGLIKQFLRLFENDYL